MHDDKQLDTKYNRALFSNQYSKNAKTGSNLLG